MSKDRFNEIVRFCVVGGVSFVLDYSLLFGLTEILNINYLYSAAISFVISVVFNYCLCVNFVFQSNSSRGYKRKVLFISSSIVGLGINQLCMYFLVDMVLIDYLFGKIVETMLVTIWNYMMKRKAIRP